MDSTGYGEEDMAKGSGNGHDGHRVNSVRLLGRHVVERSLVPLPEPVVK